MIERRHEGAFWGEGNSQNLEVDGARFLIRLYTWTSQVTPVVRNLPANSGDIRYAGLIHGSGRSPGGGHGNPF